MERYNFDRSSLLFIFIFAIYLIVAYHSSGYYHWDEHYQIIEFANYKLGHAKTNDLAWEYAAAIRPSLQPAICYVIFKFFETINVTDPFFLAFFLRVLTMSFACLAIKFFISSSRKNVEKDLMPAFCLCSYFLWFLPLINVRFSAETWAGMSFLVAVAIIKSELYLKNKKHLLLLSLFAGTSILFKYQSAILVFGMMCWLVLENKLKIKNVQLLILCILFVLSAGFFIDRWLYGRFVFSIYNYFHVNLIDGVSSNYGTSPWYEILLYILKEPGPIIGLIILLALVLFVIKHKMDLIVWCILPYVIIHSIIPHKEVRFLFPLVNFIPYMLIIVYQDLRQYNILSRRYVVIPTASILIIINLYGLVTVSFKGAGRAKVAVAEYIHQHYKNEAILLLYEGDANPYQEWEHPRNTFYRHHNIETVKIKSVWQNDLPAKLDQHRVNLLLVEDGRWEENDVKNYLQTMGFEVIYKNTPSFLLSSSQEIGTVELLKKVTLYEFTSKKR